MPNQYFPNVPERILYEGPDSLTTLAYKYYNADEVIMGKSMREWCRFSIAYWHSFRGLGIDPFGGQTLFRSYDNNSNSIENAKNRLRAAFEFMSILGIEYWTFHDRDIAPEGDTIEES